MAKTILDFEQPIADLDAQIEELRTIGLSQGLDMTDKIAEMQSKRSELVQKIYSNLTRWQRVLLARHPDRPYTLDYIERIADSFVDLHGDRRFKDDHAIVGGLVEMGQHSFMLIGQQKGRSTKEKVHRNFGMPNPEGYRKALRLMKLAEKFGKPVVTLIDTPGAYPGLGAEERGQGEAIARNLFEMAKLRVPIVCIVIGEGASGGALGIGVGDRILLLENTWYSVISPEGCASILFRDASRAPEAAEAMKVTARDLLEMKIADEIIPEPLGGAHSDWNSAAKILRKVISQQLTELKKIDSETLVRQREEKFAAMGRWTETKQQNLGAV
ncbi:acetyl-CoA carboxylase carboxyltransferase subunit alpha [bacterium]|nr:acetyl-CoA carboxylase carboxyltransferase subunit alpha [bacterium]MBL7052724.1 acetyl-CoA carboxylase carboxyltransferase subunit alpha [Candidatus Neomarinimicrobiota bacterium]